MYYIIENNKFLTAEKQEALQGYSNNIKYVNCTQEEFKEGKYIKSGDEIILNPNYEAQKAQERQREFYKEFFLTSLGYIRRKVSMSTGETRDFLFDLLPAIKESVSIGQPYPVIVYKQPDFTKEITTEYLVSLQEFKNATEQFCKECTLQIGTDFSGVPMTLND